MTTRPCGNCGSPVPVEARFCGECGASHSPETPPLPPPAVAPPPPAVGRSRGRRLMIAAGVTAFGLIVAVVFVVIVRSGDAPPPAAADGDAQIGDGSPDDALNDDEAANDDAAANDGPANGPAEPSVVLPATIPTGLVITTLVEGSGDSAQVGDEITVHYVGVRSADGVEFDSSYDRGVPFTVVLGSGSLIDGWESGLLGARVGDRRQLDMPADLAYGDVGAGAIIRPGDALTFVIDVVAIVPGSLPPTTLPSTTVASTTVASTTVLPTTTAVPFSGPVIRLPVAPGAVSATCVAEPGTEADGVTAVPFDPSNVVDGLRPTAWRCRTAEVLAGSLRIEFDGRVRLTEIGMLPGYDKFDPTSGVDRFFQNHRVRAAEWRFSDGSTVVWNYDDSATVQNVAVDVITTSVTLRVLSSWPPIGEVPRDFIAVSEIELRGIPE